MRLYDCAESPNCYKVRLALAQLGIDYERVPTDIFGGDTLTDDYEKVNPCSATSTSARRPESKWTGSVRCSAGSTGSASSPAT